MFNVVKKGANRLDIEFGGKLDSEDMKKALDDLAAKAEGIENGRMLYRVTDFRIPTLAAMGVEFSRLPRMFGLIRRFDRAAVLADKQWLQKISEIEGALIPGLEIRGFDLDDESDAEAWLMEN